MSTISPARPWRTPVWGGILTAALIAELVWFSAINRNFFGGGAGMLSQIESFIPTGILAMGSALVILTGNIDLSVGAMASLASVVVGAALVAHVNIYLAILLAIAVTTVIGLINGLIVTLLGIDSLLVTLATQFIASSLAVSLAGDSPPSGFPDAFITLGEGTLGPIPVIVVIFVVVSVCVALLFGRTRFGRRVALVGYNPSAAKYTGIPVTRTVIGVFTLSGVIAGIAGVVLAAYFNAGRSDSGLSLLLPAITCVVLGGVDIFDGRGRIGEVFVAVLLLGYLTQGMLNAGFSSLIASMVTGLLLIVALVIKIAVERPAGATLLGALRHRVATRVGTLVRKR